MPIETGDCNIYYFKIWILTFKLSDDTLKVYHVILHVKYKGASTSLLEMKLRVYFGAKHF